MDQRCADPTFGLNEQALAVLYLLAGRTPQFADYNNEAGEYDLTIYTFPWYSGREKGVALVVSKHPEPRGPCLVMVVAEHRSSDDLFVDKWEQDDFPRNGPDLQSRESLHDIENLESRRVLFKYGAIGEAADHIYNQMEAYYKRGRAL